MVDAAKPSSKDMKAFIFGQHIIQASRVCFKSPLSFCIVSGYQKPVLPGHVLVCTRRKVERLTEMTSDEVSDMFQSVHIISKVIEALYGVKAMSIGLQDGADAGQTVKHVHVHIVPRRKGDFDKKDEVNPTLPVDSVNARELRAEEDMAKEAMHLRKLFPKAYTEDL